MRVAEVELLATGERRRVSRRTAVAVGTAWFVVATLVPLVRNARHPWSAWWAEDGGVFYPDALRYSFTQTLKLVYNDYLQIVVRPVAEVASWFSPAHAPLAMAVMTNAVVALISLYVWRASRDVFISRWAPILMAGLVVVLPQAGFETANSVADLHWYLDFACLWALWRPADRWSKVATGSFVVLLATVSDPLAALFLLPGAVALIAFREDRRRRLVVVGAVLVGLVIQLAANGGHKAYSGGRIGPSGILRFFVIRVVEAMVVGERVTASVYDSTGVALAWILAVVVAVVLAALLWRVRGRAAWLAGCCIMLSGAFVVLDLHVRGGISLPTASKYSYDGSRYTVTAALLLWAAVFLLVERLDRPSWANRWHLPRGFPVRRLAGVALPPVATVAVVVVLFTVAFNWRTPNVRDGAPSWTAQLAAARRYCALPLGQRPPPNHIVVHDSNAPRPQASPDEFTSYIAPVIGSYHDFSVIIPCSKVGS